VILARHGYPQEGVTREYQQTLTLRHRRLLSVLPEWDVKPGGGLDTVSIDPRPLDTVSIRRNRRRAYHPDMAAIVVEEDRTLTAPAEGAKTGMLGGLSGGFWSDADVVILGYD